MFNYIKGKVTGNFQNGIVLENNSIGFEINVPANSPLYLAADSCEQVTVYTYMAVREDDISLYGFDTVEELEMFKMLTTVSGIGNRGALALLSALAVNEIRKAIAFDDPAALANAQGIGKKTAQKIVIELKDKIGKIDISAPEGGTLPENTGQTTAGGNALSAVDDAVSALVMLGYTKTEAAEAAASAAREGFESAEELIKASLKRLGGINI